jgi:hypothetical protein
MTPVAQLGSAHAKFLVTEYLASDLPNRLINFRNAWSLDDITLPDPALYLTYEPVALDTWPTIITVAISTKNITRMGYVGALNPEYQVSYSMRTYIWTRTEGSQACTEMRDRLTTVVRSSLLDGACMQSEGFTHSTPARIEEGTITEEFSDLTLLKGDRVLAGSYIGYDITMMESELRGSTLPDVSSITIDPVLNG